MYQKSDILFLLVTPPGTPMTWLGTTTMESYECWLAGEGALSLQDVRGMSLQHDESKTRIVAVLGSPYVGDTPQKFIAMFPTSVEILGKVEDNNGTKSSTENTKLFQAYQRSLQEWHSILSGISLATPADMPQQNVRQFIRK